MNVLGCQKNIKKLFWWYKKYILRAKKLLSIFQRWNSLSLLSLGNFSLSSTRWFFFRILWFLMQLPGLVANFSQFTNDLYFLCYYVLFKKIKFFSGFKQFFVILFKSFLFEIMKQLVSERSCDRFHFISLEFMNFYVSLCRCYIKTT